MTISFMINIKSYNSQWRSIFHVTNTGKSCCSIGDRVPALWISCCDKTSLYIANSTPSNGNATFHSADIPLNTPTQIDIKWSGIYIYVYYNGLLVNTFYNKDVPIEANPNASVYISSPWHLSGTGYEIQNFTIKNS